MAAFVGRVQLGVAGVGRDQKLLETLIRLADILLKALHSALQGALIVLAIVVLHSVRLPVLGEQVEIVLRALVVGHRILVRPLGIVRSREFQSRFYPALIRHIKTGCFRRPVFYPALSGTYPALTRHLRAGVCSGVFFIRHYPACRIVPGKFLCSDGGLEIYAG